MRTALLALFLVGCGSPTEQELAKLSTRSQTDCGKVDLLRSGCSADVEALVACFNTELDAGRPATLSWRRFSVEGDPIVTTVFTTSSPPVSEFVDTRADAFGPQAVTKRACTGLQTIPGEVCPVPLAVDCR